MSKLKITQIKSGIATKPNHRETLRSLGLKRIGDTVIKEDLSLIHISEPTRQRQPSRMPSSA